MTAWRVMGQFYSGSPKYNFASDFMSRAGTPGPCWTGGWMGPRFGRDDLEVRKFHPRRAANHLPLSLPSVRTYFNIISNITYFVFPPLNQHFGRERLSVSARSWSRTTLLRGVPHTNPVIGSYSLSLVWRDKGVNNNDYKCCHHE
jgi:hypothetical protein